MRQSTIPLKISHPNVFELPNVGLKSHEPVPFFQSRITPPPQSGIDTYPHLSTPSSNVANVIPPIQLILQRSILVVTNPTPPLASIMFIINCTPPYLKIRLLPVFSCSFIWDYLYFVCNVLSQHNVKPRCQTLHNIRENSGSASTKRGIYSRKAARK